jgi:hypothetical protein
MGFGSGIRDPGSGKNLFRIPDPGVKKAPDPVSWIRNTEEQRSAVDSKTDPGCLSRILDPNKYFHPGSGPRVQKQPDVRSGSAPNI